MKPRIKPRGLSRIDAAGYIGVSPTLFDQLVADGRMPQYGRPFTHAGFGNWFRDRCDEAGLEHCSAHGLRKAGATIAAENGATDRELMAIFGWQTVQQVTTYTRRGDRRKQAARAMRLLVAKDSS